MVKFTGCYELGDPMLRYIELPTEPEPKPLDLEWKRNYLEDEDDEEEYYGN